MADYKDVSTRDVAGRMERSADILEQKGTAVTSRAAEAIRRAADKVGSIDIERYHTRVREMADNAKAEVDKNVKNVETGIKDHPFESVMIAAGAGIVAGAVIAYMGRRVARRYRAEMR